MDFPAPRSTLPASTRQQPVLETGGLAAANETTPGDQAKDFRHPLQVSEEERPRLVVSKELEMTRQMAGNAHANRYGEELRAAAQVSRLDGSGNRTQVECLLGLDESIGFEDYLNHSDFKDKF